MHQRSLATADSPKLQRICQSVLPASFPIFRGAKIEASFYPYIGLTHTIRRKKSGWIIRISDHCRNAPEIVLEALVIILACKVSHMRPDPGILRTYETYRKNPGVAEVVRERRFLTGRKHIDTGAGRHYSPGEIYREINARYFNDQIEIRRIGWGLRASRRRLGHYDPVHHTITLSPALDSPGVPRFVLEYIVFHEMLHTVFERSSSGRSGKPHPPEFRHAERAYPDYAEAKKFLRGFCRKPAENMV